MLEFIVLGQIPGTQFQITFTLLVGIMLTIAGSILLIANRKRLRQAVQQKLPQKTEKTI